MYGFWVMRNCKSDGKVFFATEDPGLPGRIGLAL